jgi:hypothetical protein
VPAPAVPPAATIRPARELVGRLALVALAYVGLLAAALAGVGPGLAKPPRGGGPSGRRI